MNKQKLSHPLINFMGHVDMYKSDTNMTGQGQGSVNSDITEEHLQENLVPSWEQRRVLQTACED